MTVEQVVAGGPGTPAAPDGAPPATHSAEWHAVRAKGIGGSDIGALLGLSNYSSPWSLWAEKLGLVQPDLSDDDNERFVIAHEMETVLASLFHRRTGLHVIGAQQMITSPMLRFGRATVDGFAAESPVSSIDGALGTVQFKTWGAYGFRDGVPADMRAQTIWEAGVAGLGRAWLAVMFAGFRFEVFEYDLADPDVADDWQFMLARAEWFWDLVETQTPPPVDGSDATADAIAARWPEHAPGVVHDADQELVEILARRAQIKARIKADTAVVDECDNEIAARIGDSELVAVQGVPQWSYRAQTRETIDAKALASVHGIDAEPFTKRTVFRVLRVIPPKKEKT